MKIAVGNCWSSPFIWTAFADTILNLQHPRGHEVKFFIGKGWSSPRRHNHLCEQAVDWGADYLCIIGSDQIHPEDMLIRLVKRIEEGCDAISALVPFRGFVDWQFMKPFQLMAWRFECDGLRSFNSIRSDGDMAKPISREDGDLQRVHIIGSGVLMFSIDHLLALPKPWFYDHTDFKSQHRVADMDTAFVWRLQQFAGATIWVDTTIKVKHLHVFPIDDSFADRFQDWVDPKKADRDICKFSGLDIPKDDSYWMNLC